MIKRLKNIVVNNSRLDFILITGSTVICSLISFIYSVYVRQYVQPLDYGIFITCTLLLAYLNYIQLGTLNSYNRDYTQLVGGKQNEKARELKDTTFTFLLTSYITAVIIIITIILFVFSGELFNYYAFGYIISAIIGLLNTLEMFATFTARMDGKFNYSAIVGIIKTLVAVFIGVLLVTQFGYFGLYAMPFVSAVTSFLLYFNISIRSIKLSINKSILVHSIKSGAPLLINNLVWTIMMSVDKFIILFFMTTEDLGVYSVALLGFTTMVLIPQSISQVFYYKMSILYGESKNVSRLIEAATKYTKTVSLFSSLASIIGFYMLPIFIGIFMPNYTDGIQAAQILIIGVSLYSTTLLFGNIFSVLKMNKQLIKNTFILCLFNIIFSTTICMVFGKTIENVAIGTAISYVLYSLSLIKTLAKQFDESIVNMLYASWLPVLCSIVPCIVAGFVFDNIYASFAITIIISVPCLAIVFKNEIRKELKIYR